MSSTKPASTKPKGPDFFSKRVQFSFAERFRKFWNNGSPNLTYFFNSFSILFPTFERLFILSVLKFRKPLKQTPLEATLKTFLAQEAQHENQISRFNVCLEQNHEYPIQAFEHKNLALGKAINKRCSSYVQLAMTMGAEHLIAVLSDMHLRDETWLKGAEPSIAALWRWHAIEEIEHKSVAFDIYQEVYGGYWTRIFAYLFVNSVIAWMWLKQWCLMAVKDNQWWRPSFWFDTFKFMFLKPGVLIKLPWPMLKYFHPKFHPWHTDNSELIQQWQHYFSQRPSAEQTLDSLQSAYPSGPTKDS